MVKYVCDFCGADAPDRNQTPKPARTAEWTQVLAMLKYQDVCPVHEKVGNGTDWPDLFVKTVNGDQPTPGEDGSLDNPFLWQSGMDVKKNLYYHCWGHEYSAVKDVKNCTVEPGHDTSIWQYVRQWPVT